ncbi:DUF6639 family protein [Defluviimonas sp. SAOS-178_SWC]|uniref:DUF6639 family protein n=1 Tax=Defluviimonas sp. SAOS-178_SWC TaxID=3121287 RepID=UPI0032217A0E
MKGALISGVAVVFVLSAAAICGALRADTVACADAVFTVSADSGEVAAAACDALVSARASLAECGIEPTRPISVSIVDAPSHPQFGVCLGYFDARNDCIEVADPKGYAALLPESDARRDLPVDVVFRGLIAHELAHALVAHNADQARIAPAGHEFIASVFEMTAYGEEAREALLAADPVRPKGSRDMVNPGIYALAPRVFANNAWQLFQGAEDGCAMIRDILGGQVSLPFK